MYDNGGNQTLFNMGISIDSCPIYSVRTLQILIQMSCKEYLEQYNLRVEQSKARGRFLVTGQAIPAGIPF